MLIPEGLLPVGDIFVHCLACERSASPTIALLCKRQLGRSAEMPRAGYTRPVTFEC